MRASSLKKPLLLGALLGVAAALSPGGLFVLSLAAGVCAALRRWAAAEDRTFVVRLFLVAFFLRVGVSLCLDAISWKVEGGLPTRWAPPHVWDLGMRDPSRDFLRIGDSGYYSERGYSLAYFARGNRAFTVLQRISRSSDHSHLLLIGWFYYTFGFSPFSLKWLNGWFGALQVIALFYLGKLCFQSRIGRWTGGLAACFPTLLVWSASNLRDPLLLLLFTMLLLLFAALRTTSGLKRRVAYGTAFGLVFWVAGGLGREEWLLVLTGCLLGMGALEWCIRRRWYAVLLLGVVLLPVLKPAQKIQTALEYAAYRHKGYYFTDSVNYRYLPDRFYDPSFAVNPETGDTAVRAVIRGVPTALWHYFLQPLPYRTVSGASFFMIPQMLLWYFLLPFALIGVAAGVRWNTWGCAFLAALLLLWIPMGALSMGSVGILVRMRDMVTPFVLLFSAAGFSVFTRGRRAFSPEAHRVAG